MENDRSDLLRKAMELVEEIYFDQFKVRSETNLTDAWYGVTEANAKQILELVSPPRAENAQVAEPVGWVLVPREPTEAMLSAGALVSSEAASGGFASSPYEMYRDMLLASPLAPQAAQCCMCGKTGLSTTEGDGGAECQLSDGRWTCSQNCWERAVDPPAPQAEVTEGERFPVTLGQVHAAIDTYVDALVQRQHGGAAMDKAFDRICKALGRSPLHELDARSRAALSMGESGR